MFRKACCGAPGFPTIVEPIIFGWRCVGGEGERGGRGGGVGFAPHPPLLLSLPLSNSPFRWIPCRRVHEGHREGGQGERREKEAQTKNCPSKPLLRCVFFCPPTSSPSSLLPPPPSTLPHSLPSCPKVSFRNPSTRNPYLVRFLQGDLGLGRGSGLGSRKTRDNWRQEQIVS